MRVFTGHKFGIVNQCSAVIVRIRVKRGIDFCSGTQKLVQTHAENLCGTGQHKVNIVAVLFRYCVSELNLFFKCGILFIGDPAVFVHLSKHSIAPSERFFGVQVRGIGRRRFQNARKLRGLCNAQVACMDAEIAERGGFNPVKSAPEIDKIHIHFKNFILCELLFHAH